MNKPYKRTRRADPLGERIIMYEGKVVKHTLYNEVANIDKVICSCSRIVKLDHWYLHIQRPVCTNYHEIVKKTPSYEKIRL
jgi:hypothetical protein